MPYLFSYPTTTLLVDDNANFCSTIMLSLAAKHTCIVSTNPIEALQLVKENQEMYNIHFNNQPPDTVDDILEDHNIIEQKFLIQEFIALSHMNDRHKKITTIILDHEMPEMNGFLFSQNICKKDISIIMLTGKATHELAVEAFNLGLIDKFLLKDSPNLNWVLSQYIEDSKHNFFYRQTKKLSYNTKLYDILFSAEFSQIFCQLLSKYKVAEYYLLNSHGCYLLITEKNEMLLFTFMPEAELNYYKDVAVGNAASKMVLDKLNAGYIPCFHETELNTPMSKWIDYLYSADTLTIKDQCYYYTIRALSLSV